MLLFFMPPAIIAIYDAVTDIYATYDALLIVPPPTRAEIHYRRDTPPSPRLPRRREMSPPPPPSCRRRAISDHDSPIRELSRRSRDTEPLPDTAADAIFADFAASAFCHD